MVVRSKSIMQIWTNLDLFRERKSRFFFFLFLDFLGISRWSNHFLSVSLYFLEADSTMEDLKAALNEHVDLVSELLEKFSAELRSGFGPAVDNFVGFFHAIDWKEPWLICLVTFHFFLLVTTMLSRKNVNFQLCLSLLSFSGVYFAERINSFLGENWKSFSSQNYFDPHGLFISVLWSGPLLIITVLIVVNTLFTLCHLMVKWKKAELRHRARLARDKQE